MKKTFSPIKAVKFVEGKYEMPAGQKSVMVQQEVTTIYGANDFNDISLVAVDPSKVYVQRRTLIMKADATLTLAEIEKRMSSFKLVKVLSNKPIISPAQQYRIEKGDLTVDTIAARQLIPEVDATTKVAKTDAAGNKIPLLDVHGNLQYRIFAAQDATKDDIDLRVNYNIAAREAAAPVGEVIVEDDQYMEWSWSSLKRDE